MFCCSGAISLVCLSNLLSSVLPPVFLQWIFCGILIVIIIIILIVVLVIKPWTFK